VDGPPPLTVSIHRPGRDGSRIGATDSHTMPR
jgi:hypothetical protein